MSLGVAIGVSFDDNAGAGAPPYNPELVFTMLSSGTSLNAGTYLGSNTVDADIIIEELDGTEVASYHATTPAGANYTGVTAATVYRVRVTGIWKELSAVFDSNLRSLENLGDTSMAGITFFFANGITTVNFGTGDASLIANVGNLVNSSAVTYVNFGSVVFPITTTADYMADQAPLENCIMTQATFPSLAIASGVLIAVFQASGRNKFNKAFGADFSASPLTDIDNMFAYGTHLIECDLSLIRPDDVYNVAWMFNGCSLLSTLDMSPWAGKMGEVRNMTNFMTGCTLDSTSYDAILNQFWTDYNNGDIASGLVTNFGGSKFSAASATAKTGLTTTAGWTITDAGAV